MWIPRGGRDRGHLRVGGNSSGWYYHGGQWRGGGGDRGMYVEEIGGQYRYGEGVNEVTRDGYSWCLES